MAFTVDLEAVEKAKENAGAFYCVLRNIDQFDVGEIRGTLSNLISPNDRDNCFLAIYWRAVRNVATILALTDVKHFQATTMLARALFELAVDIKLVEEEENAVEKMHHFSKLESLRAARKAVDFASSHPTDYPLDVAPYRHFIEKSDASIRTKAQVLWPGCSKLATLKHWSEMSLEQRAKKLSNPFEDLYACYYKQLSWQVHSGLAGIINQPPQAFANLCTLAIKIAADSYEIILMSCIKEFRLSLANERILDKLEMAKALAGTSGDQQAAAVMKHFGFHSDSPEITP